MRIKETRLLRGPSLYADTPCLLAVIDASDTCATLPGFCARLLALLPDLPPEAAARLSGTTSVAYAVEAMVMELQRLAGAPGGFSSTVAQPGHAIYRVACGYALEQVATEALDAALELVAAVALGNPADLAQAIAGLQRTAERHAIGTSTGAVLAAAHRRGIPSLRLTDEANLFQLGWGSRQQRLQATVTGATNSIAVGIASDKQLTKTLLEQAGVPVPHGVTVRTPEEALRAASSIDAIVTVKPLDANQGKGVTTMCATPEEVERAFEHARSYSRRVIVEEYLEGRDYRVLVTGGKIAAASWRRPPFVTGDGTSTVRELVELENRNPARGEGHSNILTRIPLDDVARIALQRQGMTPDSVPQFGQEVELRGAANLSTGGTAEDVTDLLPEDTRDICIRAARTIGLDVAGIDIVCQDIARPLREQDGGIIEVNAAPGIRMHQYPSRGAARDAGAAIIEALFGEEDGRIPLVAVTGSHGKTTTALLIEHAARTAGVRTGAAFAHGVCFNGELGYPGDGNGYRAARSVLSAPDVDFAVLETTPGDVLHCGLAFGQCDVSVVLNVSAGHLDRNGVDSIDELARVHAVVAQRARRAVVLNAEDERCVDMAVQLAARREVMFFALDAEHPVLVRHLERGGRGAYLQDTMMVLADGVRHQALLDVRHMPCSLAGAKSQDVANALAAACALAACGFGLPEIADGLSSFISASTCDPLPQRQPWAEPG